jgi:3-hydroxyacyl-[acyl-carrier-protein] dehydratase
MNQPSDLPTPIQAALQRLPHGPEFRFVDRLLELDPGRSAIGEYRVRGDEYFLRGHFPGDPLMPGVLLVEAVAQLAGVVAQSDPGIPPLSGLKLTALRNVKIQQAARPGETVRLEARLTGRLGPLIQAAGQVFVNSQPVLTAELTLAGDSTQGLTGRLNT